MVSDSTPQAGTTILPAMSFTPVEPRLDAIVMLRRNSASSRSSSHTSSATPTNNSSPRSSANTRFTPGPQSGAGSNSPPLTPVPSSLLQPVDEEPNTPSSTVVEFGDLTKGSIPSAAELVENIHRTFSQSHVTRSESRSSSKAPGTREGRETRDQSRSRGSGLPSASVPRERSQSIPRAKDPKSAATEKGLAEDRINRFLLSMAQQAAQTSESELLQENQSLHQRIAALQRTERDLLAENQDLTRKFTALKHHHDRRARQWSEGLRRKETEYEARIQEMSEQLLGLASTHPQKVPTVLSNEEISAWFDDQDAAWNNWSSEFGHMDPGRLSNGLHPLQLQELCDDVKGFVRMTDTGTLPAELVSGGKEAIHTLLNGMLANFVCAETLASPLWVFAATSLGTLESPGIVPAKPLPGLPAVGFRMDMNSFSDVAPLRPGANPTPRSPQFPPPLITSMMPPLGGSASLLGLPVKSDMERLVHMLTDAQDEGVRVAAHQWRAQMMRLFADGGFSLKDVAAAGRNESRRTFVESRLNYARKLKERFLGGAARFLLQDQDSSGIEKLERVLMDMIDDALRFSCRLWSRVTPLRLHGWKDLGGKAFGCSTQLVTLCHAQAPATCCKHHERSKDKQAGSPAANHGDRSVIMVVQPGVVTDNADLSASKDGSGGNGVALVWLRARVMVAGPIGPESSAPAPAGVGSQPSPRSDSNSVKGPSTTALTGPTPKPDTPKSFEVLPASSYTTSIDAAE